MICYNERKEVIMEIQCPHCFAIFRIAEDRTLVPGGIERCPYCGIRFVTYFVVLKDDEYSVHPPDEVIAAAPTGARG